MVPCDVGKTHPPGGGGRSLVRAYRDRAHENVRVSSSFPWVSKLGLEAVIRQMPVAVIVVEASSLNIVEVNDAARVRFVHTFGITVAERLTDDFEIFDHDGRPYAMSEWPLMRSITMGEEVIGEEYYHVLADGTRLMIRSSSGPIYDEGGEIVAGVLVAEDVTEEKRVQEELRYHASLLDNVEDAVIATDAEDFLVTAWNRGAELLYGHTAQEALGRPARELATYPGDETRLELERELLATGRTRIEFTARRKDGTAVEVELIAAAVKDDRGEITGYLGIHRDITERRRAEAALGAADAKWKSILESITDEFIVFDEQWGYTHVNEAALRAINAALGTDLAREDLLGKTVWDLFPGFAGSALYAELEQGRRDRRFVHVETYSELDGRWLAVAAFPWNGGLTIYTRDISERRLLEARLEEARELERSRISRALHDEPLQVLSDALAIAIAARRESPSGPTHQLVPLLQMASEQVREAIYELRLETREVPFAELLKDLVEVQQELAGEYEISLDIGEGVSSATLGGRGVEVVRIVGEALTNARRHADARHVEVRAAAAEGLLVVDVSDDGRGFAATGPGPAGHYGIASMRERAERLGAELELLSEQGVGTTVRLRLSLTAST
jgi:PAS domain S-box-containing protein